MDRSTGGKPAQLYEITPAAEELFPRAYAVVLGGLIRVLEEREGGEPVMPLLREVGARVGVRQRIPGSDMDRRVEAAAEVLRSLGGDMEVERTGTGWYLRG